MNRDVEAKLNTFLSKYPIPTVDGTRLELTYGTAGFRSKGKYLDHVIARMALVAGLSSHDKGGAFVGLCITASHNPACDNGVKFVEPNGKSPVTEFEVEVTKLVNSLEPYTEFLGMMKKIQEKQKCGGSSCYSDVARVLIGRDTRESGVRLSAIALEGLQLMGTVVHDFGCLTSPQLYFCVQYYNIPEIFQKITSVPYDPTLFTIECYAQWYGERWNDALQLMKGHEAARDTQERPTPVHLIVDAANGAGGVQFSGFAQLLKSLTVDIKMVNDGSQTGSVINHLCGADYVKKESQFPEHIRSLIKDKYYPRCCSLDGDADRVVYFTCHTVTQNIIVLDGDHLMALFAKMVLDLLRNALRSVTNVDSVEPLRIAAIQTGYANGSSTGFLNAVFYNNYSKDNAINRVISWNVIRCPTGVKHLARRAEQFDVAMYFESNGHGTITTKLPVVLAWAQRLNIDSNHHFRVLVSFLRLFEHAEGDAMLNVLATELALWYCNMSTEQWTQLYTDMSSEQKTIPLPRTSLNQLVVDPDDETRLVKPESLATRLKSMMASMSSDCRAFLRPSGTEDLCRIYAEALCPETAHHLATQFENELKLFFKS